MVEKTKRGPFGLDKAQHRTVLFGRTKQKRSVPDFIKPSYSEKFRKRWKNLLDILTFTLTNDQPTAQALPPFTSSRYIFKSLNFNDLSPKSVSESFSFSFSKFLAFLSLLVLFVMRKWWVH